MLILQDYQKNFQVLSGLHIKQLEKSRTKAKSINFFKGFILILIFACLFVFSGCASSIALKQSDKLAIQSVNITKDVKMPERMFYQGRKESILSGCGCLGVAAAESGRKKTEESIKDVMEKANIEIGQIVRDQFINEIKDSNLFKIVSDGNDAEFRLSIRIYGFAQPHGLSSQLKPMLGVEGSLVELHDDRVVWKKYEYVTNLNDKTPSHSLEEYFSNTELIREALNVASQIVVGDLIDDMRGE